MLVEDAIRARRDAELELELAERNAWAEAEAQTAQALADALGGDA